MDPQRSPASAVNPDAGSHKVTSDPVELEAARRAADETWKAHPYFAARYGERGRRFGFSDAGWLVTLCDRTKAEACEQVHWLAIVLSSRGMPSILLERHLESLHWHLCEAVPKRAGHYDVLRACAKELRQQRLSKLGAAKVRALPAVPESPVPGIGELLAAAVADEANGIARAVSSMQEWLCSRERFPAEWIAAVERAIDAARAAVAKSS